MEFAEGKVPIQIIDQSPPSQAFIISNAFSVAKTENLRALFLFSGNGDCIGVHSTASSPGRWEIIQP